MLAHLEKGKGINLNNPIYAGIIGFFRLDNKKENLFFKEICRDYLRMCSFCCIFVPDLRNTMVLFIYFLLNKTSFK